MVDHQADFRVVQDVADAAQRARIAGLRLLVDRGVHDAVQQGVADRDGVGLAARIDGGEPAAALPIEEGGLLGSDGCGRLRHVDLSLHYGYRDDGKTMVLCWPRRGGTGEGLGVMRVRWRTGGWRGIAMALVMVASAYPDGAGAVDDVTPTLPPGASLVQTVKLDADGDGTPDTVVLYTRR